MSKVNADALKENMINKGIKKETIQLLEQSGIHFEEEFAGFDTVEESIEQSVHILRSHPLLPRFVKVHGLAMDPSTGKVDSIRSEEHTSELQSRGHLVCRLLLETKNKISDLNK